MKEILEWAANRQWQAEQEHVDITVESCEGVERQVRCYSASKAPTGNFSMSECFQTLSSIKRKVVCLLARLADFDLEDHERGSSRVPQGDLRPLEQTREAPRDLVSAVKSQLHPVDRLIPGTVEKENENNGCNTYKTMFKAKCRISTSYS
eukprot:756423-Hanusia_phi.AAC.3